MLYVIVCGEQEKLGRNIYEKASLITSPTATTVSIVKNPAVNTANGHKLDTETSIVGVTAVLHDTQGPVDSTANLHTLDPVVSIVADPAVLPDTQGPMDSTANLRTLDPEVSIVADQVVLHGTQDRVDSKANHRTLDPVVSIVAEAVLHNMRDRIAKGVASTAQNVDSLRK